MCGCTLLCTSHCRGLRMNKIVEVKSRKQMYDFVDFPNKLYSGCLQYVPAFFGDEMRIFSDEKNPFSGGTISKYFLCYNGRKVVGRIGGIICKRDNENTGENKIRFTRFDTIDDIEVATLLFDAVAAFGAQHGMQKMHGPLGYNDQEREGMVISGFEHRVTFVNLYNYDYYPTLMTKLGFEKEVDYYEFKIYPNSEMLAKYARVAAIVQRRTPVVDVLDEMSVSNVLKNYGDKFFKLLDDCYSHLHGYMTTDEKARKSIIASFKLALDKRFVSILRDENNELVAFGVAMPSIAKSLQQYGGKLHPLALVSMLLEMKKPEVVELALIAVRPDMKNSGVNAVVMEKICRNVLACGVPYVESNAELEYNANVQNLWKGSKCENHRNRRIFIREICGEK